MHGLKVGCAWLVLNPFDLRILWWRNNIKRNKNKAARGGEDARQGEKNRAAAVEASIFFIACFILFVALNLSMSI